MKNSVKSNLKSMTLILLSGTIMFVFFTACDYPNGPDDTPVPLQITPSPKSFIVGPEGGSFQALNGNVSLGFPKGALDEQVRFVVKNGPEDSDNDFFIKSIELEPKSVIFNAPVRLRFRFDGQLSNRLDPYSINNLAIFHFKSEVAFDLRYPKDMVWVNRCYINSTLSL